MAWTTRVTVGRRSLLLVLAPGLPLVPGLALVVGLLLAASTVSHAEHRVLAGHEIFDLLAGNTAMGVSGGTAFRQYYYPDGQTIWLMEGGEPANGRWRLTEEGEYCVLFRFGDWACYAVTADGDSAIWVREGNRPFPARVVKGRQLHFD
jgi:hypothetical protein